MKIEGVNGDAVTYSAKDNGSGPSVCTAGVCNLIAHERGTQRSAPVNHEDLALRVLGHSYLDKRIVLETTHRPDSPCNRSLAAKQMHRGSTHRSVFTQIEYIASQHHHRLPFQKDSCSAILNVFSCCGVPAITAVHIVTT